MNKRVLVIAVLSILCGSLAWYGSKAIADACTGEIEIHSSLPSQIVLVPKPKISQQWSVVTPKPWVKKKVKKEQVPLEPPCRSMTEPCGTKVVQTI